MWITTNCGKFFKRWEHQTTLPASFVAQLVKNLPAIRETWVGSLGWEDPLEEKGKANHSSVLRNLYDIKKQQLELDMEQQSGSKLVKE